ncbi:MAG: peptide/nickel transport system permease protein [Actinomycetota bacterium]|nr:peptide/nickel transport system permease protein [Actinomycetota bacterium]
MKFVARRVAVSVVMLIAISILIFIVLRALPGDPVIARLGTAPGITSATLARLRAEAGLDQPLFAQYWTWVSGIFHGNLGDSYFTQTSVSSLIQQSFPPTLEVTILSIALAVAVAVPAAATAARRPGGWVDRIVTALSSAGMAFPPFIAGILLLLILSVRLHLLPARGYTPLFENPGENLIQMIQPAIALAISVAPLLLRHLRNGLGDALATSYARTAEGKGASLSRVVWVHALRNASLPSFTMLGLVFGYTLGGSVIIEYMFGISGLGSLAINAAFHRDYAVLQSVVLLVSALFILVNLVIDLLVWRLDPRMRSSNV